MICTPAPPPLWSPASLASPLPFQSHWSPFYSSTMPQDLCTCSFPFLEYRCSHIFVWLTSLFPSLPLLCLKFHLFAPSPASAPSLFTFCLLDTFHPLKKCNSRNLYDRAEILLRKLKSPAKSLTWLNKKTYYITFIQK